MTYDYNWRDHPDYRDEDYTNDVHWRYRNTPGGRFNATRKQQAKGAGNIITHLVLDDDVDARGFVIRRNDVISRNHGDTPRARMTFFYRLLRKQGYRLAQHHLYTPAPTPPPPSWAKTQTAEYWHEQARNLEKTERIYIAAAYTFEREGRKELAEQYWRIAEDVHVAYMDNLSEASTLQWYEDQDRDL